VGPNSTSSNSYTFNTILDLNRFYGKKQFFYLQVVKTNYTNIVQDIVFDVKPISVEAVFTSPGVSTGSNAITPDLNSKYNITITLNNTLLGVPFTTDLSSIRLFMTGGPLTSEVELYNLGDGRFTYQLSADRVINFTLTLRVSVPSNMELQYQVTRTFNVYVSIKPPTGGIPEWVFWLVFGGLIGVTVWFVLYQVRFKYPPLVRKIHDLKRVVARGKVASRIPKQRVKTREENIFQIYAKQINEYGFLQTRDSRYAARTAGYAPTPDQSISLEFEMPAIDKAEAEQLELQMPKAPGKAPARQYTEVEPPAAPASAPAIPKPMTRPAPLQPGAKPIAPMKPVKPTGMKFPTKPSILTLPKPAAPLVKPVAVPTALPSTTAGAEPMKTDNLYQELVLLEQKRYKAERSLRDLDAKHARGVISDEEYNEYNDKIKESLDKLKENIAQLRRKMLTF